MAQVRDARLQRGNPRLLSYRVVIARWPHAVQKRAHAHHVSLMLGIAHHAYAIVYVGIARRYAVRAQVFDRRVEQRELLNILVMVDQGQMRIHALQL